MRTGTTAAGTPGSSWLMGRFFIALMSRSFSVIHHGKSWNRHDARRDFSTHIAIGWQLRLAHLAQHTEGAAATAFVLVNWHPCISYQLLVLAISVPGVTSFSGPSAFGLISKSKISVGIQSVAQALGISTMPLICPSTGAVPRIESACSPL